MTCFPDHRMTFEWALNSCRRSLTQWVTLWFNCWSISSNWYSASSKRSVKPTATSVGVFHARLATKSATTRSDSCPMPVHTGTLDREMARHTSKSLKASRSSFPPPPRTKTIRSGREAVAWSMARTNSSAAVSP